MISFSKPPFISLQWHRDYKECPFRPARFTMFSTSHWSASRFLLCISDAFFHCFLNLLTFTNLSMSCCLGAPWCSASHFLKWLGTDFINTHSQEEHTQLLVPKKTLVNHFPGGWWQMFFYNAFLLFLSTQSTWYNCLTHPFIQARRGWAHCTF